MRYSNAHRALRIVLVMTLLASTLLLGGCSQWFPENFWGELQALLEEWSDAGEEGEEAVEQGAVQLALTYPAGASPNVFTTGWVFGARASVTDEDGETRDVSNQVKWSGTGSFSPAQGNISRPSFGGPGSNTIKLSVEVGGETYEQEFSVSCVDPGGYAAVGDLATCDSYSFGCLACPHTVTGPITTGSPNVFVRGKPAARVGDRGVHAGGCASPDYEITSGDGSVMINGRPAATWGSETRHSGGHIGSIVGGG